ncbi:MAG: hypothetical protein COV48_11590, partial [Elusimicrobia bacterium CG11_big_fil_rev_8_21_14_0_20_64_6]
QEAGVVGRKSFPFEPPSDDKGKFLYCAIAPGADWVLDSQEEHVEEQYLKLVARALNLDARSSREQNTGVVGFCGRLRSPTPIGDLERIDATWRGACQYSKAAPHLGRYTCTAVSGGTVYPPGGVVVQTLKALARSPHAKTAMTALRLMEEIRGRDKFFAKTVSEVLRDIKTPSAARERAAEILASVHTHDLSGHTLAAIWGDPSNSESLRRAALRGYSLVLSFGDPRTNGSGPRPKDAVRERLHRYLPALIGVVHAETVEGKDGKDRLTPLGEEARCVAEQYSPRWLCYAKRYGSKWHEEVKKDEAAGVDVCAKDGKLKR